VDFYTLKINIIQVTGLAKDALHIYVGVGVYLLGLLVLRPIIKNQRIRSLIALILVIGVALLGEYFDNRHIIRREDIFALGIIDIKASLHDLVNTCLLPYVLYAFNRWTTIFHPTVLPSKFLKKRP
jgi:hypothetical protein